MDQRSRGWRSHSMAMVSIRARAYLPAPAGPERRTAWGLGGEVVGALDEGADLAELDEQLRRVGRQDEHVGVGLDEDAGVFLVGLAKFFAGGDCTNGGREVVDAVADGKRAGIGIAAWLEAKLV